MRILLAIVLFLILAPIFTLYFGWAYALLWGWFFVPLGLPVLNWAAASGIASFIALPTAVRSASKKDDKDYTALVVFILAPVWAVLVGYVVHHFAVVG